MIRFLNVVLGLLLVGAMVAAGGVFFVFYHFGRGLPEYAQLADYEPPVTTRVYAGDGRLLAEYAVEKRVFVPIRAMPKHVIQAFLSAEDKNFFIHPGVDPMSVIRALVTNLRNLGGERRLVGASTITQQVAKNFLLSNEVSWERKVKEAILAFRIERVLSKERVLELYLNEIYLGFASYGVAAAALNYFDHSLDELTIAEAAFLAALPKAPNNYNPVRYPAAAQGRRDWVIDQMVEAELISSDEAARAKAEPPVVRLRASAEIVKADYFAEDVRRELASRYGERMLYEGGLAVRTTLDPNLQMISDRVLRDGLEIYDRRHGWRGPVARLRPGDWRDQLARVEPPPGLGRFRLAAVVTVGAASVDIGFADGSRGRIPLAEMTWARHRLDEQAVGPKVERAADVVAPGDVICVEAVTANAEGVAYTDATFALRQIPDVEGALVAIDPHTGRILAMSGGYDYTRSQYNRASQARRQPGSAFKPFVYLAGLDSGYTPATLILDAPIVLDQGPGLPKWRPENYAGKFYGPTTMRQGLEKSRNVMTVRLAQTIGMEKVASYAERFGVVDKLPHQLAMSLGAGETTLLRLTAAYGMFVNGGKKVAPTLIDRVQDRHGRTVFRHDERGCSGCLAMQWTGQSMPVLSDIREKLTDPASAYQMVSMLQGVVDRGTGIRVKAVGKPLAGKTGTTNDSLDSWFVGFSPDLAVGVFVGFDSPRTLGRLETGGSIAAPIFRDFMAAALANQPATPFRTPSGIRLVRIRSESGEVAQGRERDVIVEAFKPGSIPAGRGEVLEGVTAGAPPTTGTGGLY